jgi:hypothetical protein
MVDILASVRNNNIMPRKDDNPLGDELDSNEELYSKYIGYLEVLRENIFYAENYQNLNDEHFRRVVFSKLSYGLRKTGDYLAWAKYHQRLCTALVKRTRAEAGLYNFGAYVEKRKLEGVEVKTTDSTRALYVDIDEKVKEAEDRMGMVDGMVEQFNTMKYEFIAAISTIKVMIYGMKDSDFMSSNPSSASE